MAFKSYLLLFLALELVSQYPLHISIKVVIHESVWICFDFELGHTRTFCHLVQNAGIEVEVWFSDIAISP